MKDILIQLQSLFSDRFGEFENVSSKLTMVFENPFSCGIGKATNHLQITVIGLQSNDALIKLMILFEYLINNNY